MKKLSDVSLEDLSNLQLNEIIRLLDERYVYLQLRLRRLAVIFSNHPEWKDEIKQEMELIDSISKIL